MTYGETKRWLSRGYRTRERIKAKIQRIQNWYDIALGTTAALKEVAVAPSMPGKKVEKYAIEIADMQQEILAEVQSLKATESEIAKAIAEKVDIPNYAAILEMRYTAYMTWEEIASAMHFTLRWTMTLHDRAVRYFSEKAL